MEAGNAGAVARERRFSRPAAFATFAAVALYVISVVLEQSSGLRTGGADSDQLRSFHEAAGTLLAVTVIRSLGFLLISVPLFHLFGAARARSPRLRPEMAVFCFLAPLLFAVQGVVAWIASNRIADDFVASAAGNAHPVELAEHLIEADSLHNVASGILIPAVLALMVALIYISLHAMRTGLLTRFGGSFGIALGVAMFLIFPVALMLTMLWLLYVGATFVGWIPGGQPPAWASGEAIPWPTPGERAAAALGSSGDGEPAAEPGTTRRKRKQRT